MGRVTHPEQDRAEAIGTFWRWWSGRYRDVLAGAITEHRVRDVIDPLFARLTRVHPYLGADLQPGTDARVRLVIQDRGGAPEGLVEQVLAAAPEPDAYWEYGPDEPISDPRVLNLPAGQRTIDLARMRVGVQLDEAEKVVDLAVSHPDLATLPPQLQDHVANTALNAVAGHDPPERYRARLRLVREPEADALDLAELREYLAKL